MRDKKTRIFCVAVVFVAAMLLSLPYPRIYAGSEHPYRIDIRIVKDLFYSDERAKFDIFIQAPCRFALKNTYIEVLFPDKQTPVQATRLAPNRYTYEARPPLRLGDNTLTARLYRLLPSVRCLLPLKGWLIARIKFLKELLKGIDDSELRRYVEWWLAMLEEELRDICRRIAKGRVLLAEASLTIKVVDEETPMEVGGFLPPSGSQNVPPESIIWVEFTKPVDPVASFIQVRVGSWSEGGSLDDVLCVVVCIIEPDNSVLVDYFKQQGVDYIISIKTEKILVKRWRQNPEYRKRMDTLFDRVLLKKVKYNRDPKTGRRLAKGGVSLQELMHNKFWTDRYRVNTSLPIDKEDSPHWDERLTVLPPRYGCPKHSK